MLLLHYCAFQVSLISYPITHTHLPYLVFPKAFLFPPPSACPLSLGTTSKVVLLLEPVTLGTAHRSPFEQQLTKIRPRTPKH